MMMTSKAYLVIKCFLEIKQITRPLRTKTIIFQAHPSALADEILGRDKLAPAACLVFRKKITRMSLQTQMRVRIRTVTS